MSTATINDGPTTTESKRGLPLSFLVMIGLAILFLAYVFSAPFLHDGRGFPLEIQKPAWSAAMEGPFSGILRPYFKLCGIDFQAVPQPQFRCGVQVTWPRRS